jgi:hypothetical protein
MSMDQAMNILAKLPMLLIFSGCTFLYAEEVYTFHNGRQPGQIDRVQVTQEIHGEVTKQVGDEERSEKIDVAWKLDYFEKSLTVPTDAPKGVRSLRWYENAEAKRRIGTENSLPELQHQRMLLGVEVGEESAKIFSPRGPMTSEELELVDVIGNSLLLDGFLPAKPVKVGDSWNISEKILTPFSCWDVVSKSDVQCTLKEVTGEVARFAVSGRWKGAVNGVAGEMEIKARFRYDRRLERIDWCGMLTRERRPISFIEGGLDVISRHDIRIVPQKDVPELADDAVKDLPAASTADLLLLKQKLGGGRLEITHDRRWHLCNDLSDVAELRRVVQGEWTVQCKVSVLPDCSRDKLVSLEQFKEEVQKGLGESFGDFVEAAQQPGVADRRALRVSVRGIAKSKSPAAKDDKKPLELPMRWIYYHLSDARGRQAAVVFVLEEKYLDRCDGMDEKLVGSLKFLDRPRKTKEEREGAAGKKKNEG